MRRIILTTYDSAQEAVFALRHLLERLASKDWVVCLKAITVFHRVFREGDTIAIEKVVPHPEVFGALSSFQDVSDSRAIAQSVFVRNYAGYMVEKLGVFQALGYEFEKPALPGAAKTPTTVIRSFSARRLLKVVPKLQRQLNMLFMVDPNTAILDNGATVFAFTLVIKDAFRLFHVINDAILIIIDAFFDMKQDDALKSITLYQEYIKESDLIRDLMRKANSIPGLNLDLPSLKPASTGLLEALEAYVNEGNFEHTEAGEIRDVGELLGNTPLPDTLVDTPDSAAAAASSKKTTAAPLISFGDESFGSPSPSQGPGGPSPATDPFGVFDSVPFEHVLASTHSPGGSASTTPTPTPSGGGGLLQFDAEPAGNKSYDQKQAEIFSLIEGSGNPAWAAPGAGTGTPFAAGGMGVPPTSSSMMGGVGGGAVLQPTAPALASPLVPVSAGGATSANKTTTSASTNPFDFGDLVDLSVNNK